MQENFSRRYSGTMEFIKKIVAAPIQHFRASKLREAQANVLLSRNDLTLGDVRSLADLAIGNRNTVTVLRLATRIDQVIDASASEIRAGNKRPRSMRV